MGVCTFDTVDEKAFLSPGLVASIVELRACVVEFVLIFGRAGELEAEDSRLVCFGLLILREFFDAWCVWKVDPGQPCVRHVGNVCSPLKKIAGRARPDTPVERAVKAARRMVE